ncbi:MAG: hypothetical protein AAF696_09085 [Bacteroidota bacterium]
MKHRLTFILLLFVILPLSSRAQGILLKGKLKLNKSSEVPKLQGLKLTTDFEEGTLWLYFDVQRGSAQNWLINSEPWGSIRLDHDEEGQYYGRSEMGQNFVEFQSWTDTATQQVNWVIKSLEDVFFLRKNKEAEGSDYILLRQIVTRNGRAEVFLMGFNYSSEDPKWLQIEDEAPLVDLPLLMKVTAAWLATMESLEELKVLSPYK